MNKLTLQQIRQIVEAEPVPTGDPFLDARYEEQIGIIGHTNPYYRSFYRLARALQPAFSVELGSWQGTAAAHLAAGYPAGQVVTIDIHKDDPAAKLRSIEAASYYPNLTYLNGWTWDVVDAVRTMDMPIEILFIDAWHEYQYAIREWELYRLLLANTALVICDDLFDSPGTTVDMLRFWSELTGDREIFVNAGVHPGVPMGFCLMSQETAHKSPGRKKKTA